MKTTTYICDTCKQSVSKEDLVELQIQVNNLYFEDLGYKTTTARKDICKACIAKKGFVIEPRTAENEEENSKKNTTTLKTQLVDILMDLGVCFCE